MSKSTERLFPQSQKVFHFINFLCLDLDHILLLHIELERLFEKEELSCVFKEGKTKELVYRIVYPAELLGPLIEQFQSLSSSVASFFLARLNVEIGEYERALKIYSELDSAGSKDVFQDFWMVERIFFKGIAFEFSGQLSNAISEYQLIFKIENKFNSIFFAFWSEKILFRLGFLLKMYFFYLLKGLCLMKPLLFSESFSALKLLTSQRK